MASHFLQRYIGDRAFYKTVFSLMLPLVIQNTVMHSVNLLDNLMIGKVGTFPMAGVAIVNQLVFIFNLSIFGGVSGPSILSTQFVGAQNMEGVRHCFRMKFTICMALSLICCLVFGIFSKELLVLFLQGKSSTADVDKTLFYATHYLFCILPSLPLFAISSCYSSTLREFGEATIMMIATIVALGTNLFGNYVLIFGHLGFQPMGVVGAAIATVISRFLEALILVVYTHCRKRVFPFIVRAYASLRVPLALVREVCLSGMPIMINECLWAMGLSMIFQCYSMRGIQAIAVLNIVFTVINVFNCMLYSIGTVTSVIVGNELGRNHLSTVRQTANCLIGVGIFLTLIMTVICCGFADELTHFYNVEPEIQKMAAKLLYVAAIMIPINIPAHVGYFSIRAGGRVWVAFMIDCGFVWVIQLPVCAFIAYFTSIPLFPFFVIANALILIKVYVNLVLLKKDFWIQNLAARNL